MNYKSLEDDIVRWASAHDMVQALVVIGSRARNNHPADSWSDLDLILTVTDPQPFVQDGGWLPAFGEIWLQLLNFTRAGDPEWMVLYAGGFKVDFILTPARGPLSKLLSDSFYALAARRGVRILVDKEGDSLPGAAQLGIGAEWVQPTTEEFTAVLNQFWLLTYRASNILLRGDLWRACMIIDSQLRQQILRMMEWQAKAVHGPAFYTWYDGRFLDEWAEPQALLPQIFAPFNKVASRRAIMVSMTLMDRLAGQTAEIWGYAYPIPNQTQIQDWIEASLFRGSRLI